MHRAPCAGAMLVALSASAAHAASGGDEATSDLLYRIFNFLMLLGVLVFVARKPVKTFFSERRETIQTQLAEAAQLQREAEETHARWQRQLVDLEREIETIQATASERAEQERTQLLADARASAERIRRDAAIAVDQELRRARKTLRQEASELAIQLASELLRERVEEEDRARLLDEFIDRIERGDATAGTPGNGVGR